MGGYGCAMPAQIPVSPNDFTWLQMDRPTNLMHIRCILWYRGEIDLERFKQIMNERQVERFDVFRQLAVLKDGHWYWEDYEDFDIDDHIREVTLPGESDVAALQEYIAAKFPVQFDFDIPLWELELIRGVRGLDDEPCTVVWQRYHHAVMDGIRYVQLLVHLHDFDGEGADALPKNVGRETSETPESLLAAGLGTLKRGVDDVVDVAKHALVTAAQLPQTAASHLARGDLGHDLATLVHPSRLISAVERLGSMTNESLNTAGELARLATSGREVKASWSGKPVVEKRVRWITGMELEPIKEFGRRHGGTFNDVVLAMVSRALTRYLDERATLVDEIHWMVPVSLSPTDRGLPTTLGNNFALVYLPMPLGIYDSTELIKAVQERMGRLKNSQEPAVAFEVQRAIARAPKKLSVGLSNMFASKAVGVLTNVPGPTQPMYLDEAECLGWIGWVPTSGDEPLGLCIFSYNGKVFMGVATDAELIPHPERIAELIEEEYADLVRD